MARPFFLLVWPYVIRGREFRLGDERLIDGDWSLCIGIGGEATTELYVVVLRLFEDLEPEDSMF